MKKILCLLAAVSILMVGCGTNQIVLDSTGGEYYVTEEDTDLSEKVKPKDDKNNDKTGETKPPKVKDDADKTAAVTEPTEGSGGEDAEVPVTTVNTDDSGEVVTDVGGEDTVPEIPEQYKYHLEGIVIQNDGSSLLINEVDLRRIELKCDPDQIKDLNVGDQVTVKYDGELDESYPQKGEAYSVEVTAKADKKYEMRRFAFRDKFFTVMVPANWTDRTIDYPQEGDFTDWGVRLQPAGSKGSIDISWHSAFAIRNIYDRRKIKLNGYNVTEHSKTGVWMFIDYTMQSFVVSNNFYNTGEFVNYQTDVDLILRTIEFI